MEKQELKKENFVKKTAKFVWEEMNLIQVLKAVTQWLILLTMIYSAVILTKIYEAIRFCGYNFK